MLPFVAAGAALIAGIAGGVVAIYRAVNNEKSRASAPAPRPLGVFVVWGRPNVGKTTFIARLRGVDPKPSAKTATTSRTEYPNVTLKGLEGGTFSVQKIVDMPGTEDRFNDWLAMVATDAQVFYMIDLSRLNDRAYMSRVKLDVAATVRALASSTKTRKRINIIATHVDVSKWGQRKDDPGLNNVLESDPEMRALYESLSDVSGYIYSGDLTDKDSFQRLLQSIVNDCGT